MAFRNIRTQIRIAVTILCLFCLMSPAFADLADGLVAHYPFNGNADDASGNGNHGTENGGVGYKAGKAGRAASFDGVDDLVVLPDSLRVQLFSDYTISFWIKTSQTTRFDLLEQRTGNGTPSNFNFGCYFNHDNDNGIYFTLPGYNSPSWNENTLVWAKDVNYADNVYHHVGLVKDTSTSTMQIYMDGALIGSKDIIDIDFSVQGALLLGMDFLGSSAFDGEIDELYIHNRSLTEDEIQALYQDPDGDGILDDGDLSGAAGDSPCTGGLAEVCDDNCPGIYNPDQADSDGDGIGDACPPAPVFGLFQEIPTNGVLDWEYFEINSEKFLAVANHHNDSTFNIDSKIYQWDGTSFIDFQSIPTNGAFDWEYFKIGEESYLVVANYNNGSTRNIDSKIYRWDGIAFIEFQAVGTNGALDWEHFEINGEPYLVVANYNNDATYNNDSQIFKWNGDSFEPFQTIPTNGAYGWESFIIDGETYLAVANYFNGSNRNIESKLYKWDGISFIEHQAILTNGATDWESFENDGETYLALANHHNNSTYNVDSKIYLWDGDFFTEFQSIPTNGALAWESFKLVGETYLVVANYYNNSTHNTISRIYRFDGYSFVESQEFSTNGAYDWESFDIDGQSYLAVANYYTGSNRNIDSRIYTIVTGPQIIDRQPRNPINILTDTLDSIAITFSEAIDFDPGAGGSFTVDDVTISGPDGQITPLAVASIGGNEYEISFNPQTSL